MEQMESTSSGVFDIDDRTTSDNGTNPSKPEGRQGVTFQQDTQLVQPTMIGGNVQGARSRK